MSWLDSAGLPALTPSERAQVESLVQAFGANGAPLDFAAAWDAAHHATPPLSPEALDALAYGLARRQLELMHQQSLTWQSLTDLCEQVVDCAEFIALAYQHAQAALGLTSPTLERIGRYQILEEIGGGGFGRVYLAWDPTIKTRVAIKTLQPNHQEHSASQLLDEARVWQQLCHEGIVPLFHADIDERVGCYLVMKYIRGTTLAARLQQRRPPLGQAVDWLIQLAAALEYAHRENVIHRDLKPLNILLDPHDRTHITDFGLAFNAHESHKYVGEASGTVSYMSPEQSRGEPLDERTDVWSLGVIGYQLLTGRRPFEGPTIDAVLAAIRQRQCVPPRELVPSVPDELSQWCLSCFAPQTRRPAVAELLAGLRDYRLRCPPGETGQLVIRLPGRPEDFDSDRHQQLQKLLAEFLRIPPGEVQILGVQAGSILITLALPATAAEQLLTAYRERSPGLAALTAAFQPLDITPLSGSSSSRSSAVDATAGGVTAGGTTADESTPGAPTVPTADGNQATGEARPSTAALQRARRLAAAVSTSIAAARSLFELPASLVSALDRAAGEGASGAGTLLRNLLESRDPLLMSLAGADDSPPIETQPLWFTYLRTCPTHLHWHDESAGPWEVTVRTAATGELLRRQCAEPRCPLEPDVVARLPAGIDVRWEVWTSPCADDALPRVRGVFRLAPADTLDQLAAQQDAAAAGAAGIARELARLAHLKEALLLDEALAGLLDLAARFTHDEEGFLVRRALAALYQTVARQLSRGRNMGSPEGVWATERSHHYLTDAYRTLGFRP